VFIGSKREITVTRSINFLQLADGEMIAIGSSRGEVVLDPLARGLSPYLKARAMAVMDHPANMTLTERVYLCCVSRSEASQTVRYVVGHSRPTVAVGDEVFLINSVGSGYTHFTATGIRIVPG
jgi:hypothetical protein